jgi:hypothetical protein
MGMKIKRFKRLDRLFKVILVLLLMGTPLMGCAAIVEKSSFNAEISPLDSPTPIIKTSPVSSSKPPATMVSSLQQTLSQETGIPVNQLKMVESNQKTWSDGCLGLGKPEEICSQALVQGWQITFSNGTQRWVYRTNGTGNISRLETSLPQPAIVQPKG